MVSTVDRTIVRRQFLLMVVLLVVMLRLTIRSSATLEFSSNYSKFRKNFDFSIFSVGPVRKYSPGAADQRNVDLWVSWVALAVPSLDCPLGYWVEKNWLDYCVANLAKDYHVDCWYLPVSKIQKRWMRHCSGFAMANFPALPQGHFAFFVAVDTCNPDVHVCELHEAYQPLRWMVFCHFPKEACKKRSPRLLWI